MILRLALESDIVGIDIANPNLSEEKPVAVMGRPTKFKKEMVKQAEKLCELGATDCELADFFEVDVETIRRWKHKHPDFCGALKVGKELADARVERALYSRAVGYKRDNVKIFMPAGAGNPVYAPYVEEVTPDTTAAIFWLKNRKPAEWRDKVDHSHATSDATGEFIVRVVSEPEEPELLET